MFPKLPIRAMALLVGAILATGAHAQTKLQAGKASEPFELMPGQGREFELDVPEDGTHLKFLLESNRELQDNVDLFVRFAEPFDPNINLSDQVLYYAIGETGFEHLEITYASSPPLSPGAWYALVINTGEETARGIELTAALQSQEEPSLEPLNLEIVYTDAAGKGFKDQSVFPGQGGNTAQTLGDARKAALERAVVMLEESFTSPVDVTVEAHFVEVEEDENGGGMLASARPTFVFSDFPGARAADTWYASSIVPRLTGTDNCRVSNQDCKAGAQADMVIQFNTNADWWYGFDRDFGANGFDFIAVAVHEFLHGLGFTSFADVESGTLFCGREGDPFCRGGNAGQRRTDAYLSQLVYQSNGELRPVDGLNDASRVEAFTSQSDLLWDGEYGKEFWGMDFIGPGQRPPLYAPSEPNPGSSVSHVSFPDIMFFRGDAPTRRDDINIREGGPELGAAWYMLRDAGWDEDPKEKLEGPPQAEVPRGVWYDRARDGHGFDFQRVGDNWFLLFYTYDDAGNPEWYLSVGTFDDGVFSGELQRFTYDASDPDGNGSPQSGEPVGSVTLDLDAGTPPAACEDDVNRDSAVALAEFAWQIGEQSGTWCAEPLLFGQQATDPDFTGNWYAGSDDDGWGMTIQVREQGNGNRILLNTLYFYDDEGNPRWAQGVTTDFLNDHDAQAIDMQQFDGYARDSDCTPNTCTLGAGTSAGPLRLRLQEPLLGPEAGSRATLDVEYLGPEGGEWVRDDAPIQMISDPS